MKLNYQLNPYKMRFRILNFRTFVQTITFSLALSMIACKGEPKKEETAMPEETKKRIQLVADDAGRKVDVMIDGNLFTSYQYPTNIKKPVLYPPLVTPPKAPKLPVSFH